MVIFDFDGTIADSLHLFINALNRLSDRFGYKKILPREVDLLRSKPTKQFLKHLNISLLKLPFVLKRVRREINKDLAQAKPSAELRDVILDLKRNGCMTGILTSNTEQNVKEFLINNNLDVFDFLYSGNSIFGKGRILKAIIRKNGLAKGRTFYVGDEIRDIHAAKKARVMMIAVSWGFNTPDALERAGPDHLVTEPGDLRRIVLGQCGSKTGQSGE